jgi:hypothetical protein
MRLRVRTLTLTLQDLAETFTSDSGAIDYARIAAEEPELLSGAMVTHLEPGTSPRYIWISPFWFNQKQRLDRPECTYS